jgi:hypothetical protein
MRSLVCLVLALATATATAQNDAVFHSLGWTVYLDYMQGPPQSYTVPASQGSPARTEYRQEQGVSLFTMVYNFRYNLKELSSDAAISLSASPALGFYTSLNDDGSGGIGHINLPIALGWEYGAGSTYNSAKSTGTFIRAGWEYTSAPLFSPDGDESSDLKKSWGALSLQSGIRYYNKKNRMREINLKYFRGGSGLTEDSNNTLVERRAWGFRMTWVFILNY